AGATSMHTNLGTRTPNNERRNHYASSPIEICSNEQRGNHWHTVRDSLRAKEQLSDQIEEGDAELQRNHSMIWRGSKQSDLRRLEDIEDKHDGRQHEPAIRVQKREQRGEAELVLLMHLRLPQ